MNAAETRRRLPPDLRDDPGIARCVDDVLRVSEQALRNPDDYPPCRTLDVLIDHLTRRTLPPLWVISKVVSWTLFVMAWRERNAPLSDDERAIRAAAERLWAALGTTRV